MISEEALIKILTQISNVDKTPEYKSGTKNANGTSPNIGCRWCTPKEICQQYLNDIEHGFLDEVIELLIKGE